MRNSETSKTSLVLLLSVLLAVGAGLLSLGCRGSNSKENTVYNDNEEEFDNNTTEVTVVNDPVPSVPTPDSGFYNIPNFSHMSAVGCNRGHGHDKQAFGVQLKAGGTFQVKQTNLEFGKNVTVEFLHYVSGAGPTLSVPSNGDTVSWTNNTDRIVVPVLRGQVAPANGATPVLEFERAADMIDLTIWDHEKAYPGGVAQFYKDWETNSLQTNNRDTNDGYAIIISPRISFLVHVFDKYDMSGSTQFNDAGIARWLNYYTDLVNYFDYLLGLDDSQPWNAKVNIRYFCKPHQDGAGSAYYTNTHIAMSNKASTGFGKSLRQSSRRNLNSGYFLIGWWGSSHEIAHGYEGDARSTLPGSTGEVWNNFYTIMTWDSPMIKKNYIPDGYGTRFSDTNKLMAKVKEVGYPGLGGSDYDRKLYFFTSLYESLGEKFFINYNQEIRRMAYMDEKEPGSPSRFAKHFGALDNINLIPYFEYWGLPINQETRDYAQKMNSRGMAVIESVVTNPVTQNTLINAYSLKSKFNVISNEQLRTNAATKGITGSATVNITIDKLNEIKDKQWHLMDGNKIVQEGVISGNTINITGIKLGTYILRMPDTENSYLISEDNATILIRQGSPAFHDIKYNKAENQFSNHKRIATTGDYTLFTFDIHPNRVTINGPPNKRVTRSGGSGVYISIEVLNAAGQKQHYQEWLRNTHYSPENIEWQLQEGWQVKIYHLEPGSITRDNRRRRISNGFTDVSEDDTNTSIQKMQTVTFTIRNGEVIQEGLTEQQRLDILKNQIDIYAEGLSTIPVAPPNNKTSRLNRTISNLLLAGIDSLPEPDRTEYMNKYKAIIGKRDVRQ